MTPSDKLHFHILRSETRVTDTRKELRSNMEWLVRHLTEELQRLDALDSVTTMECSPMRDLPKNLEAFKLAKEMLAALESLRDSAAA